jgi:uncharacterized membrane protein YqhA
MSNKIDQSEPLNPHSQLHEQPKWFARALGATRYVMALAVFAIFVGSVALLISATFEMFGAVWHEITHFGEDPDHYSQLRVHLIEALDTILVSTVLYVIAVGLYQLFVNRALKLPKWLQTDGVGDLEKRLAGMVVTVLAVMFVTQVLQWHEGRDLLGLGLAIAAVIAAISMFLYQESKFHHVEHDDEFEVTQLPNNKDKDL